MLRKWIEAIASKLGVSFKIVNTYGQSSFTGSPKRMQYLQPEWELKLHEQDIEFSEMESRIKTLEDEVAELHHEVSHVAQDIQELKK